MTTPATVAWFHADHSLTEAHRAHVEQLVRAREGFFAESFALPEGLSSLPSGLHGPLAGDAPVPEGEAVYRARSADRPPSRLCAREPRPSRLLTVIGVGPDRVFTAYGGPLAPREPGDATLDEAGRAEAEAFWAQHALSGG